PERLVHAPLGVSTEFSPCGDAGEEDDPLLRELGGRPFLLHVGSPMRRKRLDVLFQLFGAVRSRHPSLVLVQLGGRNSPDVTGCARTLGINEALILPDALPRLRLARLYRRARLVLVPSESEGFGLPVIEALASGSEVVASELPVLREVGGDAVHFAPVAHVDAWVELVCGLLEERTPAIPAATRLARAERFRWRSHASTILAAYQELLREQGSGTQRRSAVSTGVSRGASARSSAASTDGGV
ncbi:MAG: glycosyltransferase, partial [Myxococcaceae bacterium]|nr:glycosyltransferase [Myxococcaceae bacterium]